MYCGGRVRRAGCRRRRRPLERQRHRQRHRVDDAPAAVDERLVQRLPLVEHPEEGDQHHGHGDHRVRVEEEAAAQAEPDHQPLAVRGPAAIRATRPARIQGLLEHLDPLPAAVARPARGLLPDAPGDHLRPPARAAALVVEAVHLGRPPHQTPGQRPRRHHDPRRRRHRQRHGDDLGARILEPRGEPLVSGGGQQALAGQRQPAEPVETIGVADGRPDREQRRRLEAGAGGRRRELGERRHHPPLGRGRALLNDRGRGRRVHAGVKQPRHHLGQGGHPHVADQGGVVVARQQVPADQRLLALGGVMGGDQRQPHRLAAVGRRDPGPRQGRHPGGHARHHLERDALRHQRLGLLAAAAEDVRVAALEPDHPLACAGEEHQQRGDLLLGDRMAAGRLADRVQLDRGRQIARQRPGREPVVHHRVGLGEAAPAAHREQAGAAGTGAHQRHQPGHRGRAGAGCRRGLRRLHPQVAGLGRQPLLLLGPSWHARRQILAVDGGLEEPVEARLLLRNCQAEPPHLVAEAGCRRQPLAPLGAEPLLEQPAQAPRRERSLARRADGQLQLSPANAGRQVERAQLRVVGHVGPDAGVVGIAEHLRVDRAVVGRRHHQPEAAGLTGLVGPSLPGDPAACGQGRERRHRLRGHERDQGSLLEEALDLAQGDAAAAHHQAAPVSRGRASPGTRGRLPSASRKRNTQSTIAIRFANRKGRGRSRGRKRRTGTGQRERGRRWPRTSSAILNRPVTTSSPAAQMPRPIASSGVVGE